MPELPEVERVRRTLEPHLLGQTVRRVDVFRDDVVTGARSPAALLEGARVARIERLGKQLALIASDGRVACIHLGMTGSLCTATPEAAAVRDHTHLAWRIDSGVSVIFRDPRRFGGVWTFPSEAALWERRWSALGEDALKVQPRRLHAGLSRKRTPLKAALLDQAVVAGLGNIYVDELLHACRLHPLLPAGDLDAAQVRRLVGAMRRLLDRAIEAGGSTLRDYVDGNGQTGGFQNLHRVYGRGGQPCRRCRATLLTALVAGRTTVHCPRCQPTPALGHRV